MKNNTEAEHQPDDRAELDGSAASDEHVTASDTVAVEDLQAALVHAQQDVLRAQAELENFRKRLRRDYEDQLKYAALPLVRDMIPAIDNLQRALAASQSQGENSGLSEGVRLVAQQFVEILARHHCKPIESLGQPFDPNFHEALGQMPNQQYPAGVVCFEALQGYLLHDRVIRPSQVMISSGPPQAS
jgi:molecular chaperone GrpE